MYVPCTIGSDQKPHKRMLLMGYTCMLCIAYIKAGILFALEEHSTVNIVCNSLSFNFLI